MPVHDWSRVDAATFHAFHTAWITHLSETLNGGILPDGYYAMPEQHAGRWIADVLTLQTQVARPQSRADDVGVAVADAPPQVRQRLVSPPSARAVRRTLAIRHVSGHQIVALIEVISPANKDRATHVRDFIDKAESALALGIHVLMVDLFAPGPFDPMGMHWCSGSVWWTNCRRIWSVNPSRSHHTWQGRNRRRISNTCPWACRLRQCRCF